VVLATGLWKCLYVQGALRTLPALLGVVAPTSHWLVVDIFVESLVVVQILDRLVEVEGCVDRGRGRKVRPGGQGSCANSATLRATDREVGGAEVLKSGT
jgi:hypothetical protein